MESLDAEKMFIYETIILSAGIQILTAGRQILSAKEQILSAGKQNLSAKGQNLSTKEQLCQREDKSCQNNLFADNKTAKIRNKEAFLPFLTFPFCHSRKFVSGIQKMESILLANIAKQHFRM
jgi:hypothetical protein